MLQFLAFSVFFNLQHKVTPTSIVFSPNGKLFAVMATDGKVIDALVCTSTGFRVGSFLDQSFQVSHRKIVPSI